MTTNKPIDVEGLCERLGATGGKGQGGPLKREAATALRSQREHIRRQAEDIMTLGSLVYAPGPNDSPITWKERAEAAEAERDEFRSSLSETIGKLMVAEAERDALKAERDNPDGGMWRFWNRKATEYLSRAEAAEAEIDRLKALLGDPEGTIAHADSITATLEAENNCLAARLETAEKVAELHGSAAYDRKILMDENARLRQRLEEIAKEARGSASYWNGPEQAAFLRFEKLATDFMKEAKRHEDN